MMATFFPLLCKSDDDYRESQIWHPGRSWFVPIAILLVAASMNPPTGELPDGQAGDAVVHGSVAELVNGELKKRRSPTE